MRKIAIAMVLGLISMTAIAQNKVSGLVRTNDGKPFASATIELLKATDSSLVKISMTTSNGQFSFDDLKEGKFLISVSAVGHIQHYTNVFELSASSRSVVLDEISMKVAEGNMKAVTVTAKKPLIEQKIDRTIVNVEAAISNTGSTAMEVLEKSPGITVDKDGNVSLKGKAGVQIYIDGRPAYLSGPDLANMLRSMNASQLEQIEIMTNPPAKYDAAGNSGIINIKTKKNKQFGYNGSATVGGTLGYYPRFNESFNFNYRNGKVNLFTNLSHNFNKNFEKLAIQRNFRDEQTKDIVSMFDQVAYMKNESQFYSGKVGMDYSPSKRTTLGFVLNGFRNPSTWQSQTPSDIYDPNGNLQSKTRGDARNDDIWRNYSVNVNARHTFDSTGQEISFDADMIKYRSTSDQKLISRYYNSAGNLLQTPDTLLSTLPQQIQIYSAKIDYLRPLKNGAKFEAGIKTSYVKTDNNAGYDSLINGELVHDHNRSNHFVYEENINAAYANYSRPLGKKWSAQLGLRLENTNAKGDQLTTGENFKRNYTQLFPTAYVQYSMNEKNQFVVNYGRRINRPNYSDLNPFIRFLDRYTYEQGNPNLKPQFAHNIELSHTYGGALTTTLNYTATNDIIQQVLEQDPSKNETFIKKANIAKLHQVGIAVSGYKEVNKWWSGSVYANFFNNEFEGVVNNEHIKIGVATLVLSSQHQFKLGKGWAAEVSGWYRTKGIEGVIFIHAIGQMDMGFSKQVMKQKGSLRVNFRDVLSTLNFTGYSKYSNVDAKFQDYNYARSVSVSFTYRFSKGKQNNGNQRRTGGASDEQNRVKVSGN